MAIRVPDSGDSGAGNTAAFGGGSSPSGSGAGAGSGGAYGSGAMPNIATPRSYFQQHGVTEGVYGVFREAADVVVRGPAIPVAPGATVQLSPQTNAGAVNTADVFYAIGPGQAAKNGANRVRVAAGSNPLSVRVRNLNEIQVYSSVVGEGFSITVQENG